MKIKLRVPASTANLGPGFDIFGLALTLYNVMEMELVQSTRESIIIEVEGEGKDAIPSGENVKENVIYQAVKLVLDKSGKKDYEVRIKLMNTIPLARGLGSSASAIVGGLMGANELCDSRYNKNDIFDFAWELEGHPDNVGAAVFGGLFACLKFQDGTEKKSIKEIKGFKVIVCVPDFNLSTERARQILPKSYEPRLMNITASGLVGLTYSLLTGDTEFLQRSIESDHFHQPYRIDLIKEQEGVSIYDVFNAAKSKGALGVALSGSGPSVVAFADIDGTNHEEIGRAMENAFSASGRSGKSLYLDIDNEGVQVVEKWP